MYSALVKYGEEHGDCNVPHHVGFNIGIGAESSESLVRLGFWLGTQRKYRKNGKLKPEHERRLQILVDQGKLLWEMRKKSRKMEV